MTDIITWLLEADEPWTAYRTMLDLVDRAPEDSDVQQARDAMITHPRVRALMVNAARWEASPLKRHNDAAHPLYALTTLADFGVRNNDPGMKDITAMVMRHQSQQGAYQTLCNIHPRYGGTGKDDWSWFNCDAPTLLYSLFALEVSQPVTGINAALAQLLGGATENGWGCAVAPELGNFRGPGRKDDPCPIANVYALKALSLRPELHNHTAVQAGIEMLLWHWEHQKERKLYLFGIGTNFRKLKYPFIWYDILHVVEVLSRFEYVREDDRFRDMVTEITLQADSQGRFTAGSMYRAWQDWSFADKKKPSPWLTFLVLRILNRLQ
jgi:hypothetical protein